MQPKKFDKLCCKKLGFKDEIKKNEFYVRIQFSK
jgi:hypothetical protein